MISYQDAKKIILESTRQRERQSERIPLNECVNRYLSQSVAAPLSIPPFDNAAMDGYVLRSEDVSVASESSRVELNIRGTIAAGNTTELSLLEKNECYKIMTGALIPKGGDAIIPVEDAQVINGKLSLQNELKAEMHIRKAGSDILNGTELLCEGDRLGVSDLLPLASLGIGSLQVTKKLSFAFVSTGDELVDNLSEPLQSGQIYNSNQVYAIAYLEGLGAICHENFTLKDSSEGFKRVLEGVIADNQVDFIVSSGAVSAGDFDFIKQSLEEIGAEILFHKVKIKPGKPVLFARLPNGTFYFGLPGNPAATAAGLRFFVTPAILSLMGAQEEKPVSCKLGAGLRKQNDLRLFLKAIYNTETNTVSVTDGQESFKVKPFLSSNGWVIMPEKETELPIGEVVDFYPEFPDTRRARLVKACCS